MNKKQEIRRKVRIERIKLQVEMIELEKRIEQAYNSNQEEFIPYILQAEEMIAKGKEMLERTKF